MADIRAMFNALEMPEERSAEFLADLPDAYGRKQPELVATLEDIQNSVLEGRI